MLNGVAFDGRSSRLVFDEKINRANPKSAIEKDGYTENGLKFRINNIDNVDNLKIAVLATCFYANNKCGAIENTLSMFEMLNNADAYSQSIIGGIFTV